MKDTAQTGPRRMARLIWLSAAAGSMLIVSSCGNGDTAPSGAGTGQGADGLAGQTVRFLAAQPQAGAAEILKDRFEEETGATVEYTVVPYDQIQATAILDAQSGAAEYDVYQFWYTSIGALANADALVDLTDFIADSNSLDEDDWLPSIYDPYTLYDGKRYAIPFDGDYHMLFYNTTILDEAGLEPPTTWDEYLEVVKQVTEDESSSGVYGTALLGRTTAFDVGSSFFNRLASEGGSPFTSSGEPNMDSPEAVKAAELMMEVAPYALPTPSETGFDTALAQWLDGNIAVMEAWTDLGAFSQDPSGSQVVDQWGVVAIPSTTGDPGSALNAGWSFGISTAAENSEAAEAFIEFAGSPEMNLELSTTTGSGVDPTYRSTLQSAEYKEFAPEVQSVAVDVVDNLMPWPTVPESPELIASLNDQLALMLQGSQTPEATMQAVQAAWEDIFG